MKNLLLVGLAVFTIQVGAQEIKVKSGSEKFSSGSHDCLKTTIYYVSKDDAMDKWKSKLNDFKDEKVKRSGSEIFGDNILIKDWGNNTVDIYSVFEEDKDKKTVTMSVAVDLGGAYLTSSDKDKYNYMEKLMKEFAVKISKNAVEDELSAAGKVLDKLEDEQKDLESDNKKLKDDIEDYKKKISKAEGDIKDNEGKQGKKKSEIEAQKKVKEGVKTKLDKVN
jgi:chromosome segregation ATPase